MLGNIGPGLNLFKIFIQRCPQGFNGASLFINYLTQFMMELYVVA